MLCPLYASHLEHCYARVLQCFVKCFPVAVKTQCWFLVSTKSNESLVENWDPTKSLSRSPEESHCLMEWTDCNVRRCNVCLSNPDYIPALTHTVMSHSDWVVNGENANSNQGKISICHAICLLESSHLKAGSSLLSKHPLRTRLRRGFKAFHKNIFNPNSSFFTCIHNIKA